MTKERRDRLTGVHPNLARKVERILDAMLDLGFPMFITGGVRTTEAQQELYAQGRTKPGKIVTNADGILKKSNHQVAEDGFGHSVDLAFQGRSPWAESHPWTLYGTMAEALGLYWGGRWPTLVDRPHISDRRG